MALQELDETAYWIELLVESELVPREKLEDLHDEIEQLIAILVTCVRNAKQRAKAKS